LTANRLLFAAVVGVLLLLILGAISAASGSSRDQLALVGLAEWVIGIGLVLLLIRLVRDRFRRR
jgi:hypothetical protein